MSINLYVSGEREVTVNKTGKQSKQEVNFSLWQTSSALTREAIVSKDPLAIYTTWIRTITKDKIESIFAKDDIFCEREPVGSIIVNLGSEHLKELNEWLTSCEEEGYTIEWYEF